jgi:hypothetical protein
MERLNLRRAGDRAKLDVMLREYAGAQSSAEHYNSLRWHVISIFTAANAVLTAGAGSILLGGGHMPWRVGLLTAIAVAGVVMSVACMRFASVLQSYGNQKLTRCRKLEENVEEATGMRMTQHRGLCQYPGVHRFWYNTLEGMFILGWSALLVFCITHL